MPFPERSPQYANHGMIATSQPHAAQAGLHILREGGNAVDAAIATAIALTVVEPVSNGIGGDAFALVRKGGETFGLNGSGRSPASLTIDSVGSPGKRIPNRGWTPVTVPGAPRAWADLHARSGRLPFARLFEPAIHYAQRGFVVTPVIARNWELAARTYLGFTGPEFAPWRDTFLIGGRVPRVGEIFRCDAQARTLRAIAESKADTFYEGEVASKIADFAADTDGWLTADDLAEHRSEWVEPLSVNYRGARVWELPPNGQGVVALEALGILDGVDLTEAPAEARWHHQIEALKLAFADAQAYLGDPQCGPVPASQLLDPAYLAARRDRIGPRAAEPEAGRPESSGTVYVAAVDGDGTMVSFIQSNYEFFGSGVVVPGTGIALQNRGATFVLEEGHPNALRPRTRPYHTIIPGLFEHPTLGAGPLGVIGGYMQPQGHVQLVSGLVDLSLDPQTALDAPRFQWREGMRVDLEHHTPKTLGQALALRGHEVAIDIDVGGYDFGRAQLVLRRPNGVLIGASDGRADGLAVGW